VASDAGTLKRRSRPRFSIAAAATAAAAAAAAAAVYSQFAD